MENNFKALREAKGWTLEKLAEMSGYAVATINGLELNDEGSDRLREKLFSLLKPNDPAYGHKVDYDAYGHHPPGHLREVPPTSQIDVDDLLLELTAIKEHVQKLERKIKRLKGQK